MSRLALPTILAALACASLSPAALATPTPNAPAAETAAPARAGTLCQPALEAAERAHGLPPRLLRSIALVESGRRDPETGRAVAWPWTINAAGTGHHFATKEEAIAAVEAYRARGVTSIDVGCAQVNLVHHAAAFASLDQAFDPAANATYAGRFLRGLRAASGNWFLATAAYHSQTEARGHDYARKVVAIWPEAARYGALPPAGSPAANPGATAVDYSVYTPEFAARLRRMDMDRRDSRPAPGPIWVNRPPAPEPVGTQRAAGRRAMRG